MSPICPEVDQTSSPGLDAILCATSDLRSSLLSHPMYDRIQSRADIQLFMQHHVFAVYDFMWLVKRLQRDLCGVQIPWHPPAYPQLARFINEIVLGEETDEDGNGDYCSHFELYLQAMQDIDAPLTRVREFVDLLASNTAISEALHQIDAPASVCRFVQFTHDLAVHGSTAEVAAAFCLGREDIIPQMFQRLLAGFQHQHVSVPRFEYYIHRHIELDGDHHGPLARQLVDTLCSGSPEVTVSAAKAAQQALALRIDLWDGVLTDLNCLSN